MKIIFICTKAITFNTFLKSQAEYFIKKGFIVQVACSDTKKLSLKNCLNYEINFPSKIKHFFNLINLLNIFNQINLLVKNNSDSIFYLHTPIASHFFRLFNFNKKLNIIYFVHGFRFTLTTNSIKSFFFRIIEKMLSVKTNIFITINNEDYEYTKSNLLKKNFSYKVNGIGINLPSKKKQLKKNKIKKILVIAAYKQDKGYLDLLKVAPMLKDSNIKIECYGYCEKEKFERIRLKKKIKNLKFNNFDVYLEKKINKYDILLHLSKREGLPVSVMQCLSSGLPVICYDIRGNNDLVIDKFNGFFVHSYKDVSDKINLLNSNNYLFNRMRLNAFKSINKNYKKKNVNHSIYKIIKKFSDIL